MSRSYPTSTTVTTYFTNQGIEEVAENDTSWMDDVRRMFWDTLIRTEGAAALGVFMPATKDNRVKVRAGRYLWNGTVTTYAGSAEINPTDNDTTYIWMQGDNVVASAIDGTGWPAEPHIKLAEVVVDTSGNVTNIADRRPVITGHVNSHDYSDIVVNNGAVVCNSGNVVYTR